MVLVVSFRLYKPKVLLDKMADRIRNELRNIMFVDLTYQARTFLEKLFWVGLGTIGVIWLVYFMRDVIEDKNPLTMMTKDANLANIKYPAITICTDFSTRYAIAERLGNLYDSKQELLKEFATLRENLLDLITRNSFKNDKPDDSGIYMGSCLKGTYRWTKQCEVR